MTREEFTQKYGKVLVPVLTPYDENEEVNYEAYAQLIHYLIETGSCDSVIVTGTTGEASLLTFDERVKLMETALKAADGRVPVIAGTGCASTKETIALTKEAEKLGIELAMVVCPFYNKPTMDGVYTHFKAVAESTTCKIMLYNIPIFVGINMEAEVVHELAKIDNIIGIKDEAGVNPTQVTDFLLATRDVNPEFVVFNGDDIMLLPTIIRVPWVLSPEALISSGKRFVKYSKPSRRDETRMPKTASNRCIASASPAGKTEESSRTPSLDLLWKKSQVSRSVLAAALWLPLQKRNWK